MTQLLFQTKQLDRIAMGLSGICLVHCVGTAVALALLASAGGMLGAHIIHEIGLALAMLLGTIALGRGIADHGYMLPVAVGSLGLGVMAGALQLPHHSSETVFTLVGVGILALGHQLNRIAAE